MLFNIKGLVSSVNQSWINFKLQTKIIFVTTILISLLVSSIVSWSVTAIEEQMNTNNRRFTTDINSLLGANIIYLFQENKTSEILSFCERFYENTPNIRYILFIDNFANSYSIPYNFSEIFPKSSNSTTNLTNTKERLTLQLNNRTIGFLLVGNKVNPNILNNSLITKEITLSIFILFWIVLFLSIIFNRVGVLLPLTELSMGFKSIAEGDFSKRIKISFPGDFNYIIPNFNEMARRLQLYEERNRDQLSSEKIKLESLVTTIADGTMLLDTNLKIVLVNNAAIKIFGWKTKTRLIGTSIWDHLPLNLQKKMFVTLQKILIDSNSSVFSGEIRNEFIKSPKKYIRIILNIIYDSEDRNRVPIGIGVTLQDTTKELELDKTQNRFMSNISHELRTPLFNIKSFIETIQEYDYTLSAWQKRYFLNIVNKETNRLTRLVNDILCISKLDSIKNITLEATDLLDIFAQIMANYQITARDKNLYLHSEIAFNQPAVKGNKDLILQVLTNIVGNALKFTYPNGEILIRAYHLEQYPVNKVRIEIVDTGIGIYGGYQQNIFQRFYRIENDVHTLKGTGLGLSIVKTILSEHNAAISVISRYNIGSVFWFDLSIIE